MKTCPAVLNEWKIPVPIDAIQLIKDNHRAQSTLGISNGSFAST
jgi:hypothetical protein